MMCITIGRILHSAAMLFCFPGLHVLLEAGKPTAIELVVLQHLSSRLWMQMSVLLSCLCQFFACRVSVPFAALQGVIT